MAEPSYFRQTQFYIRGLLKSVRSHYLAQQKINPEAWKEALNVKLNGKVAFITGANQGLGYCCARGLAERGAEVHMICRSKERGEKARKELVEESKCEDDNVKLHILDISIIKSVQEFCRKMEKENQPVDILINNAGCMILKREKTSEGIEKNFATNTLGTFALTEGLKPRFQEAARVITMTSAGLQNVDLLAEDLEFQKLPEDKFDGTWAYAANKRQQLALTQIWAQKWKEDPKLKNVMVQCCHPGWADTSAVRSSMPDFYAKNKDKFRTPEEGADTAVWLAVNAEAKKLPNGQFFHDRKPDMADLYMTGTGKSMKKNLRAFWKALHGYLKRLSEGDAETAAKEAKTEE